MTIITLPYNPPQHPHLRRMDPQRDLLKVTDLVEFCFAETLDPDGRRYLQHMRRVARSSRVGRWAAGISDPLIQRMMGYVWEEDGEPVGNLSLIPQPYKGQSQYLIANVAVHPDWRGRGIARALTQAALAQVGDAHVWLHVRRENLPAVNLYQTAGFRTRGIRTTWRLEPGAAGSPQADIRVRSQQRSDWELQREWLEELHPQAFRWYFSMPLDWLRPGLISAARRLFSEHEVEQWSGYSGRSLIGMLAWQRTYASADRLWLVASKTTEDLAISGLLPAVLKALSSRRPLNLEYPADRGDDLFQQAGFEAQQSLIWMDYRRTQE